MQKIASLWEFTCKLLECAAIMVMNNVVFFLSYLLLLKGERLQDSGGDELALAVATAGREQQDKDWLNLSAVMIIPLLHYINLGTL